MALEFKIRDSRNPRANILKEVGIKQGFKVLDFGCGPGGYVLPASKLVGETGKVYALDITPLAIKMVRHIVEKNGLKNVETILSDCATGLPSESLDVALLYDVFHGLRKQRSSSKRASQSIKKRWIVEF